MKVPPYGKPLKALLEKGQLPTNSVYLYIGDQSWDKGKISSISRPSITLILPPNHQPEAYEWPVKGCDTLIIETSYIPKIILDDLVFILFENGAVKVTAIHPDFNTSYFKKDF